MTQDLASLTLTIPGILIFLKLLKKIPNFLKAYRVQYRQPQLVKVQRTIHGGSQTPMATATARLYLRLRDITEEGQKECKRQRTRKFAVRFCLLEMAGDLPQITNNIAT